MFHLKPYIYGLTYLLLIPLFAIVFYFNPDVLKEAHSFIECIYFSIVTITTLGYGDILPANDTGRIIAGIESVLGITLIGLFLNSLSRVRSETTRAEEIEKEQKNYHKSQVIKLHAHYHLINPLIKKHISSIIQITSPLKNRSTIYNPDFTLSDMKDLYSGSLLMTQSHSEPVIKHYFVSLNNLNNELIELIKMVDLKLFPELEQLCLDFVFAYYDFDFSDAVLGIINTNFGDQPGKDFIQSMLENYEGEPKYRKSNIINGYVALYYQIKIHMTLLKTIQVEFNKVEK